MYHINATALFDQQARELSAESNSVILGKLPLLRANPFRFKRIHFQNIPLFRIRFSDRGQEKRLIYAVLKDHVVLVCILDRKHGYKDLEKYLRSAGVL